MLPNRRRELEKMCIAKQKERARRDVYCQTEGESWKRCVSLLLEKMCIAEQKGRELETMCIIEQKE